MVLLALATAAASTGASAQSCSFSMSNMTFGTIDLTDNTAFDATADYTASCSNGTPGQTLQLCPNFGPGSGGANGNNAPRYMLAASTALAYNLFINAGRTDVWGSAPDGGNPAQILITLDGNGAGTRAGSVYGRIFAGQQLLPPATYVSTFSGSPDASLSWDVYAGGNCASIGTSHETPVSFSVSATYPSSCTVSATNMDFGTLSSFSGIVDTSSSLTTTCTVSTPYSITLGDGLAPAGPLQRQMSSGPHRLSYGLYQDSNRLNAWGSGANSVQAIGNGLPQSRTVYGRIPAQTLPTPGAYSDTIVVTVSY